MALSLAACSSEQNPNLAPLKAALSGAAVLKARTLKEVWNIASVIPIEKTVGVRDGGNGGSNGSSNGCFSGELIPEQNFLWICSKSLLARGCELLQRTHKEISIGKLCLSTSIEWVRRVSSCMIGWLKCFRSFCSYGVLKLCDAYVHPF